MPSADRSYVVALASAGRAGDPARWSGIPAALTTALRSLGAGVTALDLLPPGPLAEIVDRRIELRHAAARLMAARAGRRLAAGGPIDAILQLGSEFELRTDLPLVTYDDLTVAQAQRLGYAMAETLGPRRMDRWRERQARVYRAATGCGTFSAWTRASVVDEYGIAPERVHVLGWGRNHDLVDMPIDRRREVPRFLFVGVDWERKNGPAVLRAFDRLRSEQPAATLDVVGGHPRLDAPGVTGHGLLRLDRPEDRRRLRDLYAAATCFVMPSWREPAGIAYAEAAAAGLPVIATSAGGARELVDDASGCVVEPGDDGALLDAMRGLAEPSCAAAAGAAARKRAALFTWELVAERLLRALGAPEWQDRPWAAFLEP